MNATNLPKVKWLLRQISMDTAQQLLARVMLLDSPQVIQVTYVVAATLQTASVGGVYKQ